MKTTAQVAYQNHLAQQKANWSTMTIEQQDASLRTEKTLQLASDVEIADNASEAQAQAIQDASIRQAEVITEIKAKGYSGNGTLADYKKLFNHPEIFGARWEMNAEAAYTTAHDIDDFISLYQQYCSQILTRSPLFCS